MSLPPLTYLSMDGLTSGIGTSQVAPYVESLGRRGIDVTVRSFEQTPPTAADRERFRQAGVRWEPQPFGPYGAKGGLQRVIRAARACRGAPLLHARADIAAAAALLARPEHWLWDIRSFWREQRMELGMLGRGGPEERILRLVERRAAVSSTVCVTLARAAVPILAERHGEIMMAKTTVIPTCVDLERFALTPLPPRAKVVALLSGTLNAYYDIPAMLGLVVALRAVRPTDLAVLAPPSTAWDEQLQAAGADRQHASFESMPAHVAAAHLGLSICRQDLGPSLRAAMPTKLAEFLAAGRPVVVNPGLGDMDEIIATWRCGVVVGNTSPAGLEAAAGELLDLLEDGELAERCRAAAEATFDLERGVDRLIGCYEQAAASGPGR